MPWMGFEPHQLPSQMETVNEFIDWMKSAIEEAKSMMKKAQDDMTQYYNQWRTPTPMY
jgi:hypothetical protein